MRITESLRALMRAQDDDPQFPYLEFLGAFVRMEQRVSAEDPAHCVRQLSGATATDLLGAPIGDSPEDLKLAHVMSLLRGHGLELLAHPHCSQA